MGVLCNPASNPAPNPPDPNIEPPPTVPRFAEALVLCDYVDAQVFRPDPSTESEATRVASYQDPSGDISRPRALPVSIPSSHVHRLQNLFYAKGNLKLATHDTLGAMDEFSKAVEVALSLPAWAKERAQVEQISYPTAGASLRDLVLVTTIIGSLIAVYSRSGGQANEHTHAEAARLGALDEHGQLRFDRLFAKVRADGDAAVGEILAGAAVLPTVLLQPEDLNRLLPMLFPDTRGVLPCLLEAHLASDDQKAAHQQAVQLASQTTSTMLLTIAKIFQDFMASPSSAIGVTLAGIPVSQSVLLPLYYVALALHPSPSTCNNLGILLSTVNATALIVTQPGLPPVLVNGQQLALKYYRAGLALDPKHPHLYTNLGSLLKDMGQLPQAVQMYRQAVEFNPTFVRSLTCRSTQPALTHLTAGRRACQPRERDQGHGPRAGVDPILPPRGRGQPRVPRGDLRPRQRARRRVRLDRPRWRQRAVGRRQRGQHRTVACTHSARRGRPAGVHGPNLGAHRQAARRRRPVRRRHGPHGTRPALLARSNKSGALQLAADRDRRRGAHVGVPHPRAPAARATRAAHERGRLRYPPR